jgi:hypothetical protein
LSPTVVRLLTNLDLFADFRHGLSLADKDISLRQFRHDL